MGAPGGNDRATGGRANADRGTSGRATAPAPRDRAPQLAWAERLDFERAAAGVVASFIDRNRPPLAFPGDQRSASRPRPFYAEALERDPSFVALARSPLGRKFRPDERTAALLRVLDRFVADGLLWRPSDGDTGERGVSSRSFLATESTIATRREILTRYTAQLAARAAAMRRNYDAADPAASYWATSVAPLETYRNDRNWKEELRVQGEVERAELRLRCAHALQEDGIVSADVTAAQRDLQRAQEKLAGARRYRMFAEDANALFAAMRADPTCPRFSPKNRVGHQRGEFSADVWLTAPLQDVPNPMGEDQAWRQWAGKYWDRDHVTRFFLALERARTTMPWVTWSAIYNDVVLAKALRARSGLPVTSESPAGVAKKKENKRRPQHGPKPELHIHLNFGTLRPPTREPP